MARRSFRPRVRVPRHSALAIGDSEVELEGDIWGFEGDAVLEQQMSEAQRTGLERIMDRVRRDTPMFTGELMQSWDLDEPSGTARSLGVAVFGVQDEIRHVIRNPADHARWIELSRPPTGGFPEDEALDRWVRQVLAPKLDLVTGGPLRQYRTIQTARDATLRRAIYFVRRKIARTGFTGDGMLFRSIDEEFTHLVDDLRTGVRDYVLAMGAEPR